jgi:hypothetical protein
MARLCPVLNAKIRHTQIEICTISKYLQQNHNVGIYKHVFGRCQIIRSARRTAVTPEHHTTDGCVWLLSISLILCWKCEGVRRGGANLPVCTEYAEFIHLKLIANEMIRMLIIGGFWHEKTELFHLEKSLSKLAQCKVVFMTNSTDPHYTTV